MGALVIVVEIDADAAVVDRAREYDLAAVDGGRARMRDLHRTAGAGSGTVAGAVGRDRGRDADVGRRRVDVDAARRDAGNGAAEHVDAGGVGALRDGAQAD